MKNLFRLLGVFVLVGVIGFSMVACKDYDEFDCPFVGTWRSPEGGGYYVIVFADFPQTFTITSPEGNVERGDYDWDFLSPNVATMTIKSGGSGTFNVSISGNTLTFGSRTYTKS